MSNQGVVNGELLGKIRICICPNCKKQFSLLENGTVCRDCSKVDYSTGKYINTIKKVELEIDLGLLFKESNELRNLKEDIKKNMSINYNSGELKPKSISYYGEKFLKETKNKIFNKSTKHSELTPKETTNLKPISSYKFTKEELESFIKYMEEEENLDEMNVPVLEERRAC